MEMEKRKTNVMDSMKQTNKNPLFAMIPNSSTALNFALFNALKIY